MVTKKGFTIFVVAVAGKSIFPLNQWRKWKQNLNLIGPGHKTVMMTKVAHCTSNINNNHQEFNIDTQSIRVYADERSRRRRRWKFFLLLSCFGERLSVIGDCFMAPFSFSTILSFTFFSLAIIIFDHYYHSQKKKKKVRNQIKLNI